MQQREDEVRAQRKVEVVRSEIIVRPKPEKNERGDADEHKQVRKIFFCNDESEQRRIDQKKITQD